MRRRAVLAGGLLAALGASAWAAAPQAETPEPDLALLEPLYAVSATAKGLMIRAASSGCTAKADFAFHLERRDGGGGAIAFARRPVDRCRVGRPDPVDMTFSYAELGVSDDTPLFLLNPIAAEPMARPRPRHSQLSSPRLSRRSIP
jgi:hypothetical protein